MRVMARTGPAELTLALIAREAGVTAGALVQRFGSKRDLLLRMTRLFARGTGELFRGLQREYASPLRVIRAYAACMADMAVTPEALARNFAYLQADLADPDIRAELVVSARATRRELRSLLRQARVRGELRADTPDESLARNIEAVISGALLTWAFYRSGTAQSWLRAHVTALLQPYLT
jgi:AcrR family transcriptional regulator